MTRSKFFILPVASLALAACDIPTELPRIEQRWIVPVEETTLGVDELLPDGVEVVGGNFDVEVDDLSLDEDLGTLCAACIALNLTTAPKPAFTSSFTVTQTLPADVESASITSGEIAISISHDLSFDPIRPPGGAPGTLTIAVRDGVGGPTIGQIVVDGATDTFAPGTPLERTLTLESTEVGSVVELAVDVNSPAGGTDAEDHVAIDTNNTISATGSVTSLLVSQATVTVEGQSVELDPVEVDVEDIDESLTDQIQEGTITLDVQNPFGVSVSGTIEIGDVIKTFSIGAEATSTTSISYSGEELRSFLGQPDVTFSGSGTAEGGSVTVTPGQELQIEATLDVTVEIG